jgi:hypothetical protein
MGIKKQEGQYTIIRQHFGHAWSIRGCCEKHNATPQALKLDFARDETTIRK